MDFKLAMVIAIWGAVITCSTLLLAYLSQLIAFEEMFRVFFRIIFPLFFFAPFFGISRRIVSVMLFNSILSIYIFIHIGHSE